MSKATEYADAVSGAHKTRPRTLIGQGGFSADVTERGFAHLYGQGGKTIEISPENAAALGAWLILNFGPES